jgi:hypothetical protein
MPSSSIHRGWIERKMVVQLLPHAHSHTDATARWSRVTGWCSTLAWQMPHHCPSLTLMLDQPQQRTGLGTAQRRTAALKSLYLRRSQTALICNCSAKHGPCGMSLALSALSAPWPMVFDSRKEQKHCLWNRCLPRPESVCASFFSN